MEETKGEWGFKGLKQAIKMEFGREQYDKVTGTPRLMALRV